VVAALLLATAAAQRADAVGGELAALDVAAPRSEDGLPPGAVRALVVTRAGFLWIATEGGLARYDGLRFRRFDAHHAPAPPVGAPLALAESADGRLWVAGERGLAAWDGASFSVEPLGTPREARVTALAEAPDGALWIGLGAAGVCRLAPGARACFARPEGLPSERVLALAFDRGGALWVATSAGVARASSARREGARFETVSTEIVETLIALDEGILAGGESAVVELPAGRRLIERGAASPNGALARALLRDRDGDLWIGGAHLARRRAGALLLDVDRSGRFGSEISALAEDHEGNLWIGSARGELRRVLAAAAAAPPRRPPPAVVDAVEVDGRALVAERRAPAARGGAPGAVRVPAGAERVELLFTAAAFARPEALAFRYRLVGYERAWQKAAEARRATYTRLPPGHYRFEVVASSETGAANAAQGTAAALELEVEPRWYQTLAVRALAAVAAIAALALAHRWRLARHRRREAELAAEVAARTAELRRLNDSLGQIVEEQTGQIRETRDMAVLTLARLAELRDGTTGEHLDRIAWYSLCLARALADGPFGPLGEEFVEELFRSSPLHDIGKVAIPDAILRKAGPLDKEERGIMESHTVIGGDTLRRVVERGPTQSFLGMAMEIAYGHHERWDGTGYPHRLSGEAAPLPARIVALVDAYDAITSLRPYKPGLPHHEAVRRILADAGRHFDPRLVEGFRSAHEELDAIRRAHPGAAER
jgi:response regulator RpfG family c-di-GMP phosphodiesterase